MECTCPACGEKCNAINIDAGIGSYEYWGSTGFDSQPITVSDCCEAELDQETIEQFGLLDCDE